ncbi:MAG: M20/M25/M40 family metallo-hydrolase [Chloroflexota bacterium]|nr:M20/M25/M40 family metallo-hydrolase [Chloroflexota bacterium]
MTTAEPSRPTPAPAGPATDAGPAPAPHPLVGTVDWNAVTREAADLLSAYVKLDSSHPRGRTDGTTDFLTDILAAEGLETRRYETGEPGKVNLVASLRAERPTDKPVLLSSHMDVVQAVASDWTFDPFSGEIADGYVYGRGTIDMKGMGIMELLTVLLLKRHGVPLARDVLLLFTCDEEVGSVMGAKWMVEHHFADLDPGFVLDEGGSGLRGFFDAGQAFAVSVGEKRILWLKMIARAEPGHASQPWEDAATHRLLRAADKILTRPPEHRDSPAVAEMLRRLGGERARREVEAHRATRPLLRDTVSLTMLAGGYKINVLPEQAELHFDCRLLPETDEHAFVADLERLVDDPAIRFEVIAWPSGPAATAPWHGPEFAVVEQACRAHAPTALVIPSLFVAATDARFFRARGVPAYGLVPCIFTAEDLKGYHGIDERLSLDNLRLGTRIIFDLTARLAARA